MREYTDKPCKHDLKVCATCGNIYCENCGREWREIEKVDTVFNPDGSVTFSSPSIARQGFVTGTIDLPHIHNQAAQNS